jgi:hypothetical protein
VQAKYPKYQRLCRILQVGYQQCKSCFGKKDLKFFKKIKRKLSFDIYVALLNNQMKGMANANDTKNA